jgi:F-type H+-transporting ATPase subunit a
MKMNFRFKSFTVAALSIIFVLILANTAKANKDTLLNEHPTTTAAHTEEAKFDTKGTIIEHVSDSYGWHLFGHTTMPLPVILKTDKGLEVFSSKNLFDEHHHPKVYAGNHNYLVNHHTGKIQIVDAVGAPIKEAKLLDFSITKNVASLFISVALILLLFFTAAKSYKKRGINSAPKGLQSFLEPLVLFVRDDIAKPNIGAKYNRYMPFLLTIFFFIWINNMLGLVPFFPGGANLSGNIAFTVVLAVIVFLVVNFSGNKDYWKHIFWMPGVPVPMKIFLAPIELMGVFTKPISLAIRLFANITAGHILVLALICLVFVFKSMVIGPVAVLFAGFIYCIELLVAFLQAFIFTMLTALYIGMAVEEHHHHEEAHH